MSIKVITQPTAEVITLPEAKLHLRIDDAGVHPDDVMIAGLIIAARGYAEHYTQCSIGSQTLEVALDAFPATACAIELSRGPTTAITSVSYADEAGVTQTLTGSNYSLDDYSTPAWLVPAYGMEWPATRDQANAVKVRYVAGWTAVTVPKQIKSAMLLHIQLHYPGNAYTDQERDGIQRAIDSLLNTVKVWSI